MSTLLIRSFIFLLGVLVLAAGLNKFSTYCFYRLRGVAVYGVVDHPSSGRGLGGRPVVQYADRSGTLHEFKSVAKTHWFYRPEAGEKIKIYYDNKQPHKAIVDNWFFYLFLPLLLIVVGLYFCIYALWIHREPGSARRKH